MLTALKGMVEFNIHQPMRSAVHEAAQHKYHLVYGRTGIRWVHTDGPDAASNIYMDGGKGSRGMAGRKVKFELVDGGTVEFEGPWCSNPTDFLKETGVDLREKHLTKGIVALEHIPSKKVYGPCSYRNVLHLDADWVSGSWERIEKIAQEHANRLGKPVYMAMVSTGGGLSRMVMPEE